MTESTASGDAYFSTPQRLRIEVPVEVPFATFIRAQETFLQLVSSVADAIRPAPVAWVLEAVERSSAAVIVRPDPWHAGEGVAHAVIDGLEEIATSARRPRYFNDDALSAAKALALMADAFGAPVIIRNGTRSATAVAEVSPNADAVMRSEMTREYGTVEGRVEGLNVHGRRYFSVYDILDNKRVECRFGKRIPLDTVRAAVERRVAVHGTVHYRGDGVIHYVAADAVELFPREEDLPTPDDVLGILAANS